MTKINQLKAEIEHLKQENENIRQNSVSHSVFEMIWEENQWLKHLLGIKAIRDDARNHERRI